MICNLGDPMSLRHPVTCIARTQWLRLVGSLKLQVSFAEYRFFYRALLRKRPVEKHDDQRHGHQTGESESVWGHAIGKSARECALQECERVCVTRVRESVCYKSARECALHKKGVCVTQQTKGTVVNDRQERVRESVRSRDKKECESARSNPGRYS